MNTPRTPLSCERANNFQGPQGAIIFDVSSTRKVGCEWPLINRMDADESHDKNFRAALLCHSRREVLFSSFASSRFKHVRSLIEQPRRPTPLRQHLYHYHLDPAGSPTLTHPWDHTLRTIHSSIHNPRSTTSGNSCPILRFDIWHSGFPT